MIRRPTLTQITALSLALACSVPTAHAVEDARTLPKGRFRLSFNQAQSSNISQLYDSDGVLTDFVAPYQLTLDSKTLAGFDSSMSQLIDVLNAKAKAAPKWLDGFYRVDPLLANWKS